MHLYVDGAKHGGLTDEYGVSFKPDGCITLHRNGTHPLDDPQMNGKDKNMWYPHPEHRVKVNKMHDGFCPLIRWQLTHKYEEKYIKGAICSTLEDCYQSLQKASKTLNGALQSASVS